MTKVYPTRYRSIARTIEHVSQKLKRANAIERKTLIPIPKRNPWYFTQVEVDLATFSMNDFIPKSWVRVTLKSPEAQVFQFFLGWKTDGNWLLVEKMRREIDMYNAWNAPLGFQQPTEAFHVGARVVPLIYPGQEEIVFISNGTSPRASLENAFSPLILAQGGEELSVGPRCDVISFVRRARLGLIVILEVAMVWTIFCPVRNIVQKLLAAV